MLALLELSGLDKKRDRRLLLRIVLTFFAGLSSEPMGKACCILYADVYAGGGCATMLSLLSVYEWMRTGEQVSSVVDRDRDA